MIMMNQLCMMNQLRIQVEIGPREPGAFVISWNAHGMLRRIEWSNEPGPLSMSSDIPPRRGRERRSRSASGKSPDSLRAPPPILDLIGRLRHYFSCGQPLGTLPWEWIDQSAWTPFQYEVYAWIAKIPHGETRTYKWVAERMGKGPATRAVGQALKRNPLPVFIPCHRVVAADSLGGFMGVSGLDRPELSLKRRLITLEQGYLNPSFSFMSAMTPSMTASTIPGRSRDAWSSGARSSPARPVDEAGVHPVARIE